MTEPVQDTAVTRPRKSDLVPGYTLNVLLGKGGMGEVYKATQLSLRRTVALKLLSAELAKDTVFVARFEKEAAALGALSHPNIVTVVDKGCVDGTYYLVMEYVDGASLREVMRQPSTGISAKLRTIYDVCRGMEYAHGRGIIHRDLKPENILFDEQAGGVPKISDFGLAGFLDDQSARFKLTEVNVSMGTVSYMAPEQRADAKTVDHRADIYSLGVMLYELLTGELPAGKFDPPSERARGVDKRLDAIVSKCLRASPSDRYQKVAELLSSFEPLVPMSGTFRSRQPTMMERARLAVARAGRRAVRVVELLLIAAALAMLGLNFARPYFSSPRFPPLGERLAALGARKASPGLPSGPLRLSSGGAMPIDGRWMGRAPTMGPDGVLRMTGAIDPPSLAAVGAALHSPGAIRWAATTEVKSARPGLAESARRAVVGKAQPSSAAVTLLGEDGQYAALMVCADGGPARFEYSLGAERGAMEALEPASEHERASLEVDTAGLLSARLGGRVVGQPVPLGADWLRAFGGRAEPALLCFNGDCAFGDVERTPSDKGPRR